ncbi:MAG: hypothetical protein GKR90_11860 [Pseudomonadales bacterium]|nr:hypothetical protein [Pseudomonadales bacterium]
MSEQEPSDIPQSRLNLIWSVLVFQLRLIVDGLRDVVLVPISLIAALIGLIAGGAEPARYFNQILRLGRRTETWINLFGHRRGSGTSDELITPFKERLFSEAEANPWVQKAGDTVNRSLDQVNDAVQKRRDDRDSAEDTKVDK